MEISVEDRNLIDRRYQSKNKILFNTIFFFFVSVGVDEVDQFSWIGRTFGFEESTNYFVRLRLISDTLPTGGTFGLIEKIKSNRTN